MSTREASLTRISLRTALVTAIAGACALGMSACEEESPSAAGGGGTRPQSTLGKSAEYAKDTIAGAEARDANVAGAAGALTDGERVEIGGLAFYLPSNWTAGGPDGMAQATAVSPRGEVTVHFYAGIGGGVEANIERWTNQVTLAGQPVQPEREERSNGGLQTTLIASDGNYTGMNQATEYNWALRAAVVEGPRGDVMAKLVGPDHIVDELDRDWRALINSVQTSR